MLTVRNDSASTAVSTFTNEQFGSLHVFMIEDEPWFIGKEIAEALGYASNMRKVIRMHVDEEDKQHFSRKKNHRNPNGPKWSLRKYSESRNDFYQ